MFDLAGSSLDFVARTSSDGNAVGVSMYFSDTDGNFDANSSPIFSNTMCLNKQTHNVVKTPSLETTCYQGQIKTIPLVIDIPSHYDHEDSAYVLRTEQDLVSSSLPSQPIACPLCSSQDHEDMMVYEVEKMYYNTMTWAMYSRIMKSRQKKQWQILPTQKGGTNQKETPRSRSTSIDIESSEDMHEKDISMEEEIFHIEL